MKYLNIPVLLSVFIILSTLNFIIAGDTEITRSYKTRNINSLSTHTVPSLVVNGSKSLSNDDFINSIENLNVCE